jgi:[acyl-carrier-protein] S-malonyltransferase
MKIAFLFSGQGEVPSADTRALWRTDARASRVWESASDILGEPLATWLEQGPQSDTRRAQVLSVVGSLATYEALRAQVPIAPDVVLGHSVGELAAVSVASHLPLETTMALVSARGAAMQRAIDDGPEMGMTVVLDPPADLAQRVDDSAGVYVANLNSSRQTVLSGSRSALSEFVADQRLRVVELPVRGAFHTPLMDAAAAEYASAMSTMALGASFGPTVISNTTAAPMPSAELARLLAEQVRTPVRWADSLRRAHEMGVQYAVDLSSTGMFSRMSDIPGITYLPSGSSVGIETTRTHLRHVIEAESAYDVAARALGAIVTSRNENADPDAYREAVIPAYQQIRALVGKADADATGIIDLVDRVLVVKAVPLEQRDAILAGLRWHALDSIPA